MPAGPRTGEPASTAGTRVLPGAPRAGFAGTGQQRTTRLAGSLGDFVAPRQRKNPGHAAGVSTGYQRSRRLQPIEDLVGPEPLQPVQRLVQVAEFVGVDAADM